MIKWLYKLRSLRTKLIVLSKFFVLQSRCPAPDNFIDDADKISWSPVRNNDITWNFEKILIDHKGQPYRRYTPTVEPKEITEDIEKLIKQCEDETITK